MELCAFFPTRDIGTDPAKIRDWAQAAEDLGFDWIEVADHVLGVNTANRPNWPGPYTHEDPFHETFVTMGFLAAATRRIGLVSGILILPQRQTALVAKQAAEVDVLSGGRLRLGIGVGWNPVEYEALGMDWNTRGARQAEQIQLLKLLWTQELVTFEGKFDRIQDCGLNPMPVQRPIPVWLGGSADGVLKRAARYGDGWMPIMAPGDEARARLDTLRSYVEAAGRDWSSFGLEAWLRMNSDNPQDWAAAIEGWRRLGAQKVMLYPMYRMPEFDRQIETLRRVVEIARG
jgi:probable F420-dependent oxidoreductase